jgi:hypothetical protein
VLLDHVLTGVATELKCHVTFLHKVRFVASLMPDEIAIVACETVDDNLRFSVQTRRADIVVRLASGSARLAQPAPPPAASTTPASGRYLG